MEPDPPELSSHRDLSTPVDCCALTRPFDGEDDSSRKRQRLSSSDSSSSGSVTIVNSSRHTPVEDEMETIHTAVSGDDSTPRILESQDATSSETNSSNIRLDLRQTTTVRNEPCSLDTPTSQLPASKQRIELSDSLKERSRSPSPKLSPPNSAISSPSSPRIVVVEDDPWDEDTSESDVVLIGSNDNETFVDHVDAFPQTDQEKPIVSLRRFIYHWQHSESIRMEWFTVIRNWIAEVLDDADLPPVQWLLQFHRHQEFWQLFPSLIQALNLRSLYFPDWLRDHQGRDVLLSLFKHFARLTARIVQLECQVLLQSEAANHEVLLVDLASRNFLVSFGGLVSDVNCSKIGMHLQQHYGWDWPYQRVVLSQEFESNGGSVSRLTTLAEACYKQLPQSPTLIDLSTEIGWLVYASLFRTCNSMKIRTTNSSKNILRNGDKTSQDFYQKTVAQSRAYVQLMSRYLDQTIDKHITLLTVEAVQAQIKCLSEMSISCHHFNLQVDRDLMERYQSRHPTLNFEQCCVAISLEWKFKTLRKLLMSSQMQLRVCAINVICDSLQVLYNKNKSTPGPFDKKGQSYQLLRSIATLILELKLVDYIVGIDSHPEIIGASGNIVAYLAVTEIYTTSQTDMIWDTIKNSQNPQVVEATLRMLGTFLHLSAYPDLLYICDKIHALPMTAFTVPMKDLCQKLLSMLMQSRTLIQYHEMPIDTPPYRLLIRILKESSETQGDDPCTIVSLQHFAIEQLNDIAKWGPSIDDRRSICLECLEDIAKKKDSAAGSICALFILISSQRFRGELLSWLLSEHDLACLIVDEFETSSTTIGASRDTTGMIGPVHQARRDLLQMIIIQHPMSLSPRLGHRLWDVLVGNVKVHVVARRDAWQMLNTVAKKAGSKNSYIDSCFRDYLPSLDRMCYCQGTLKFARIAALDAIEQGVYTPVDSHSSRYEKTLEVVWQMVLAAPPDTIEDEAIQLLSHLYLDDDTTRNLSETYKNHTNLQVVRRCLQQLSCSARAVLQFDQKFILETHGRLDSMMNDDTKVEPQLEMRFTRSLKMLKEFLRLYYARRKEHKDETHSPFIIPTNSTESLGEIVNIRYEVFDGKSRGIMSNLQIGIDNTLESFCATIAQKTGFRSFKMWHAGKQIDHSAKALSSTMGELQFNTHLVLVRADESIAANGNTNFPTLKEEIVAHYDEFWTYLGMDIALSKEIYHFLIDLPLNEKIISMFEEPKVPKDDIFTIGQPYKSMYAVYSLREYLSTTTKSPSMNETALPNAIGTIVSGIECSELFESCSDASLAAQLLQQFSDCLIRLLRSMPKSTTDIAALDNTFLNSIIQLLNAAREQTPMHDSLIISLFNLVLQACENSQTCRQAIKTYDGLKTLLASLLLENERMSLRKAIAKLIEESCESEVDIGASACSDLGQLFWQISIDLVPSLPLHAHRSREFLTTLLFLAGKMLASGGVDRSTLQTLFLQWTSLLNTTEFYQNIAAPTRPNSLAMGLAALIHWCVQEMQDLSNPADSQTIALELINRHLFPESPQHDTLDPYSNSMPILHSLTRSHLYDTIAYLTKSTKSSIVAVTRRLRDLLPYDRNSPDTPYTLELPLAFDRVKEVRSSTGYAGLRNLSNTCYLNSLVAQLFMNVTFRKVMLDLRVIDASNSQKLLCETQALFANMQNSCRRFVEPTDFALAIRTYEETNIDITVQMDADEFYNLLFDRWEGQVLAVDDKQTFKSVYGGQLVQQVKSEECPHISERLEPFSAIQCDIKGKSSLQESLQAYVDGEVMEGDNKYKCSSCDKHVNAVKRACLKDIPDNLIFHLKRFDFSLRTLQRNKINDYFAFPHVIDMRPYKVEFLMNTNVEVEADNFELVGVLVHSGTAESGHYYSLIRERPSTSGAWFEFNDDVVSSFDPGMIPSHCFGGTDAPDSNNNTPMFEKPWSAYMLFYERSSVIKQKGGALIRSKQPTPLRVDVPKRYSEVITEDNEALMRRYALYDDCHAKFVLQMSENLKRLSSGKCSGDHAEEQLIMGVAMLHFDQVVTRKKDCPDLALYTEHLDQKFNSCGECGVDFASWIYNHKEAARMLLFKNSDPNVRDATRRLILGSTKTVKSGPASYAYGLHDDPHDEDEDIKVFPQMVDILSHLWNTVHLASKAWPEYFGLLTELLALGTAEAGQLLDAGFLWKVLDLIRADADLDELDPQFVRMLQIFAKRSAASKPVSYHQAIEFLRQFLQLCDLRSSLTVRNDRVRHGTVIDGGKYPINRREKKSLLEHWNLDRANILVTGLLQIDQNSESTQAIIAMLLSDMPEVDETIKNAIIRGIQDVEVETNEPYLTTSLTFCQYSRSLDAVRGLQRILAEMAGESSNADGHEYIHFFERLYELSFSQCGMSSQAMRLRAIQLTSTWAPRLLIVGQGTLRNAVADHLAAILFDKVSPVLHRDASDEEYELHQTIVKTIRILGIQCLRYLRDNFIKQGLSINKTGHMIVQSIIAHCKPYYDDAGTDSNGQTRMFNDLSKATTHYLDALVIEDEDDGESDWNNSEVSGSDDLIDDYEGQGYIERF